MKRSISLISVMIMVVISFGFTVSGNNGNKISAMLKPSQPASVSINFDGMMALCFGDPDRVSVGLLNVPHHVPTIKIEKVENSKRTTIALLGKDQLNQTINLSVESANSPGVARYTTDAIGDDNDFRWTVDLESDLQQRALHLKEESLFGKIHINAGLFYAARLSEQKVRFVAADNSGNMLPFNRRVAEPAAKLNLSDGDALVIKGGETLIRLVAEPGVHYQISIENLPSADMASMEHWLNYYDVISEKVTPYSPVFVAKAAYLGTALCIPAVLSRSKLN